MFTSRQRTPNRNRGGIPVAVGRDRGVLLEEEQRDVASALLDEVEAPFAFTYVGIQPRSKNLILCYIIHSIPCLSIYFSKVPQFPASP